MRRPLAVLAVLCIAVPAVALAADTDPEKRFTAADQAKARSVLLRPSDFVAGWKKVPPSPDTDATCPGFNPDNSDLTLSGEAEANFEHTQGFPRISSFADVFVTRGDALTSWARNVKPAIARCLAHFMRLGIEEEGGKLEILSQGRIAFPKVAQRTAAFRVVGRLVVPRPGLQPARVPLTVHLIGIGHGRGDAALMAMGFGSGVQLSDLRSFAKLMASRLVAAQL